MAMKTRSLRCPIAKRQILFLPGPITETPHIILAFLIVFVKQQQFFVARTVRFSMVSDTDT